MQINLLTVVNLLTETPFTLRYHWPFCIFVGGKHAKGNNKIVLTLSFSERFVLKMCSAHTKTKSRRCQFHSVLASVIEKLGFRNATRQ